MARMAWRDITSNHIAHTLQLHKNGHNCAGPPHLLELEDRSVNLHRTVTLENISDGRKRLLTYSHLTPRVPTARREMRGGGRGK